MTTRKEEPCQPNKEETLSLQPIIYGYMPEPPVNEIDLGILFSRLAKQWKLLLGITLGGTFVVVVLAMLLPKIYEPSITISIPSAASVAPIAMVDVALKGSKGNIPSSPQEVFDSYFNLLRSSVTFSEYVQSNNYGSKVHPELGREEERLQGNMLNGLSIRIEEPIPEKKGAYIKNPIRVKVSLEVENEKAGIEILNGYPEFVNNKLLGKLQNDTQEIIKNRLEELEKTVAQMREQGKQVRLLTIQKKEQENAEQIAQLQEVISAMLDKAKANREINIAEAEEALAIAKSLNIEYPTTLEALALRGQKGQVASTAVTVGEKQASSLYLLGAKYLTTLIETLKDRKNDEKFIPEINDLREKIRLIKTDPELVALKSRQSDDPWIEGLPEKFAEIETLKKMNPQFKNVKAYSLDDSAVITAQAIKPKYRVIILIGFVLSLALSLIVSLIVISIQSHQKTS